MGKQYLFGAGYLFVIPAVAVPTPLQLGTIQETTIGFSASNKSLQGQNQYSDAVARGAVKTTGKSKFAKISAAAYNAVFFNETIQTGMTLAAVNELGVIPSATPFTITVANSTTFSRDLGIRDALTGKTYTCVASAPTTGQYSVANGVYTFAEADKGKQILACYLYTDATNGYTIVLHNQPMGEAPTFMGIFNGRFSGKQTTMILNSLVSSKLDLIGTKTEDFSIPEFDFEASADSSDILGLLSTAE